MPLSLKSRAILELIADGLSYNQIVDGHPDFTYLDIFEAAKEALALSESPVPFSERMAEILKTHPKAYTPWTEEDKTTVSELRAAGVPIITIAHKLGRQPSAIRSQLTKMGFK